MMKLELTLKDINYTALLLGFLPKILQDLKEKNDTAKTILSLLKKHNIELSDIVVNVLNTFTREQLNDVILDGVNQYSTELINLLNNILVQQMLQVELESIKLEKI